MYDVLRPYMLRRMKDDVEKNIPFKSEKIVEVQLTSHQKTYYRAILERNQDFLRKGLNNVVVGNCVIIEMIFSSRTTFIYLI